MIDTVKHTILGIYEAYKNHNQVVVDRAIAFHQQDENGKIEKEDITDWVKEHFQTHSYFDIPLDISRVEVRYTLNQKKFRLLAHTDDQERIQLPYTMNIPRVSIRAIDVETGEDFSERFAKYAGPWGDFQGLCEIPLAYFFPSWKESDLPHEVRVEVTHPSENDGSRITTVQIVKEDSPYIPERLVF